MKGSAIFWYNMLDIGDVDARTKHGACPVLYGSKWILTKWFRTRGNELNRRCPTVVDIQLLPEPDSRIQEDLQYDREALIRS